MKAIDLFSGASGFTESAVMAGFNVVWAGNHWPLACEYHARNHPETEHACQDLQQADWRTVPAHDLMLAAPACQGHSPARGKKKPHHDALRSTAWAVVACAEYHRSPFIVVENVPAFERWALYPAWRDAMHLLGYAIAPYIIDAADHDVPQHLSRSIASDCSSFAPGRPRRSLLTFPSTTTGPFGTSSIGMRPAGARSTGPDAARTRWPGSRRGVARSATASWRRTTATAPA